jgi:ArsR family transcriptional regulator
MSRILKAGGRAVIVDLLPHDRDDFRRRMGQRAAGFDVTDVATMLYKSGFKDVATRPLPPEPNVKGPALFLAAASRS